MLATKGPEASSLPVELTINGTTIEARPGQTILDVVREQELDEIPTLCHDPSLPLFGSCFLCVVEVKGARGLLPSCTTRVRDGMEVVTKNDRISRARKTALELLLSDHYADCVCPAQTACPAGVDVQGYLGLARLGRYEKALSLIKERNPLPIVCGRVCVRKCELGCRRDAIDEPVGINLVKRFVSEEAPPPAQVGGGDAGNGASKAAGKQVAVVGGGPAGLTCAYYLALSGHAVRIIEAMPRLGGMLRYGIPEYRLPKAELDRDIEAILALGVEVDHGRRLGTDFTLRDLRDEEGFDAVFVALGAPLGKAMGVPGEEAEGVEPALDFLRDTELHGPRSLHGRVVVVGGGNSAVDAARTAVRSGAEEVVILYRRTRNEMPAHHEEVEAAEKEGVRLEMLAAPVRVTRCEETGRLTELRCIRMELGEPDASGRRRPVPVEGSEYDLPCSFVFAAIGQDIETEAFAREPDGSRPDTGRGGAIKVDESTMESSLPGVFAGGDMVSGPSVVIDAIAHGYRAAEAIDRHLGRSETNRRSSSCSSPLDQGGFAIRRDDFGPLPDDFAGDVSCAPRHPMPERAAAERTGDFLQVELGLSETSAREEAGRCMECGCVAQRTCDLRRHASDYGVRIDAPSGEVRRHQVDDSHPLITFDPNKCILCGRCVRACADVLDLPVIGFVGRGFETKVQPTMGRAWAESGCIACGSCIETCPTGALSAKLPYDRQGPWRASRARSACSFCSLACPLDLHVVTDGLMWATSPHDERRGDSFESQSRDLCVMGRFGTGLLHGPDRIRAPLVRRDGRLVEASWKEALEEAASLLSRCRKEHGANSVAVLAAARMTLEECYATGRLARTGLRTGRIGSARDMSRGGPRSDLDHWLGQTSSTCRGADVDDADVVLLVGVDPATTHPVLAMRLRRAARVGAQIIVVSSRNVEIARSSRLWLDPRRGTAGMLLADVLRRVLEKHAERGPIDEDRRRVDRELVSRMLHDATFEDVAGICGVDSGKMDELARALLAARKVVAVYDLDENIEHSPGDLALLARLLMLTGHLHPPGGGLLLLSTDCCSEGARLAGMREDVLPGGRAAQDDEARKNAARFWGADVADTTGASSLAEALASGEIRGALVMLEDPLGGPEASFDPEGLEALVVMDHFLTRTARSAHVVLPASTLAETDGTVVSSDGGARFLTRASRPPAGRTNLQTILDLSVLLGHPLPSARPDVVLSELLGMLGISPEEIRDARQSGRWPDAMKVPQPAALALEGIVVSSRPGSAHRRSHATMDSLIRERLKGA